MHMILIRPDLQKLYLISILQFDAHILQFLVYTIVEDNTSIFCWKHQMIDQNSNIMTLMDILTHINILRRKRRGDVLAKISAS